MAKAWSAGGYERKASALGVQVQSILKVAQAGPSSPPIASLPLFEHAYAQAPELGQDLDGVSLAHAALIFGGAGV